MPSFSDIMGAVTSFVADYQVLIYAGAVTGLVFWALRRFIKAGR